MAMRTTHPAPFSRLLREDDGAVSVEFMILLPALLLFVVFIFVVSLYLGTASDVQQAAQTLARAALPILNSGEENVDVCARLISSNMVQAVVDQTAFLSIDKLTFPTSCTDQPAADGSVSITLVYNLAGSTLSSLSNLVGLDFVQIERSAVVYL
jgi:Flp pilus assembly protein TadG